MIANKLLCETMLCIGRSIALLVHGISLVFSATAIAQTAPAPAPALAPASPRAPNVNAPLRDIRRMPGDGSGAYKTHEYRDLFAELGHSAAVRLAKSECVAQGRSLISRDRGAI